MKAQSAKAKGRRLQQWVRDQILDLFPSLTLRDVKSTPMGTQGEDVLLSEEGFKRVPFHIGCKSRKKFSVYEHYDQPKTLDQVLLIIKQDYREPLALMDARLLLEILKEHYDLKATIVQEKRGSGDCVDDHTGAVSGPT